MVQVFLALLVLLDPLSGTPNQVIRFDIKLVALTMPHQLKVRSHIKHRGQQLSILKRVEDKRWDPPFSVIVAWLVEYELAGVDRLVVVSLHGLVELLS